MGPLMYRVIVLTGTQQYTVAFCWWVEAHQASLKTKKKFWIKMEDF
jgi:hypothetical protein